MDEKQLGLVLGSFRGSCPATEDLIDFVECSPQECDKAGIAIHLERCGTCANEVRLLLEADSEPLPPDIAGDWKSVKSRGQRRFRRLLRTGTTKS